MDSSILCYNRTFYISSPAKITCIEKNHEKVLQIFFFSLTFPRYYKWTESEHSPWARLMEWQLYWWKGEKNNVHFQSLLRNYKQYLQCSQNYSQHYLWCKGRNGKCNVKEINDIRIWISAVLYFYFCFLLNKMMLIKMLFPCLFGTILPLMCCSFIIIKKNLNSDSLLSDSC